MLIKRLGEARSNGGGMLFQIVGKPRHVRITASLCNDLEVVAHSSNVGAIIGIARAFGGGLELVALYQHNTLHLCGQFDLEVVD